MLVNALNCRFQLWIADAFTRYIVQTAIICVCGYKEVSIQVGNVRKRMKVQGTVGK